MRIPWKKLKNNIPHRIKVGKEELEILWIDEFKDGNTRGEMRPLEKQIVLLKGMSNRETVETLLHECLHWVSDSSGESLSEKQVLAIEHKTDFLFDLFYVLNGDKKND